MVLLSSSLRVLAVDEDQSVKEPSMSDVLEVKLLESNIAISEWFNGLAQGIDLFLAGEKLTNRQNETSVELENSTTIRERSNIENTPSLNVNLRLPNVEEYWQLKFTTYDEQKEGRTIPRELRPRNERDQNYGATLGLFRKLGNVRTAFEPRVELQDPLKVSHSLTFESIAEVTDVYKVNPKLQFYANPNQGTGIFTALNFDFIFTPIYSLAVINQGDYEEKSHLFTVTNGLSLGQELTKTSSLSYNIFSTSLNQSVYHLDGYTTSVAYSETLYKKIFYYSVAPHLDFNADRSFTGVPGITLTIRFIF
jgi:hypothetical protein